MQGIGTDILAMKRFRQVLIAGGEVFIQAVYTDAEQSLAHSRDEPEVFYATRFAGKEAVFKTLGVSWEDVPTLREIEILEAPSGAPTARLHGKAREAARQRGIDGILISLSYEQEYAIAMAAPGRESEACGSGG